MRLAAVPALMAIVCALGLGSTAHAADRKDRRIGASYASPGKVVAAEVAFAQLAQRKGQWTAFRETAAEDAVMFVPQAVVARDWLRKQKDPARAVTWQPHRVWSSCDGSLAATEGAWQGPDGAKGDYTTVWQRQKNGEYKWVANQVDTQATAIEAPEMIATVVASCDRTPRPGYGARPAAPSSPLSPARAFPVGTRGGWSDDRSFGWAVTVDPSCARVVTLNLYRGGGKPVEPVLETRVAAPATSTRCAA